VVDPPTPETVFARLAHLPHAIWLDSSDGDGTGDWSFIAADPYAILRGRGGQATWTTADGTVVLSEPPLAVLARKLDEFRAESAPAPFDGGAAGFIGYETAWDIEDLPAPPPRDHGLPDLRLAFYDVVVGWNHRTGACLVVSTGRPERGARARSRAHERLSATLGWLGGGRPPAADPLEPAPVMRRSGAAERAELIPTRPVPDHRELTSTTSEPEYRRAVTEVIEAIVDGQVYQVNLSQRFAARTTAAPFSLYRELRRRSPTPYGALLRAGEASVLSTSPERFLRVRPDGSVETRPIKGTRPRGDNPEADTRLARALLESEKDRAENLMIVDLLRNDLSRVCDAGTIRVPELFRLESWATVHHLVSVVQGKLRAGVDAHELLAATFPCGSVTGAPKIRAMQMIAEHERVARGPYCGAIGYFGFGGHIDLSVAIRIVVIEAGRATFHAGGGIVADSDPGEEYLETVDKARAIIEVLEGRPPSR
jgi:para-aminobenzoate synthetase component 1